MSKQVRQLDNIINDCLQRIRAGEWTLDDCYARYPEVGAELKRILPAAVHLSRGQEVTPNMRFKQAAPGRLKHRLQFSSRPPVNPQNLPVPRRSGFFTAALPKLGLAGAMLGGLLVVGAVGLIVGASLANDAVPGDPLYGLDQAAEQFEEGRVSSQREAVALKLSHAAERLQEAEGFAATGDESGLETALNNYNALLGEVDQAIAESDNPDDLQPLLDSELDMHLAQLETLFISLEEGGVDTDLPLTPNEDTPEEEAARNAACNERDSHPVVEKLSGEYDVPAEDVLGWFCEGFGFGEIMLALKAADSSGFTVDEILAMKAEGNGWGQVRRQLNDKPGNGNQDGDKETGPPDHSNAGGNSDKGEDEESESEGGPPEHSNAGGNRDEDKETGPPDHSNAGGNSDKDK